MVFQCSHHHHHPCRFACFIALTLLFTSTLVDCFLIFTSSSSSLLPILLRAPSAIRFKGSVIGLKCLSKAASFSILLLFKARYFFRIDSLVFTISFTNFSLSSISFV